MDKFNVILEEKLEEAVSGKCNKSNHLYYVSILQKIFIVTFIIYIHWSFVPISFFETLIVAIRLTFVPISSETPATSNEGYHSKYGPPAGSREEA